MAKGMFIIGGRLGRPHRPPCDERRDQIDARMDRFRENRYTTDSETDEDLSNDERRIGSD